MTLCIIQARMASTRLPGKILKELCGQPMLWHVVSRVARAKQVDKIVVATTVNTEDDIVEQFCHEKGFLVYRGSAEDVLARYYGAAKMFGGDCIVRVTSDCPLIDPHLIDLCVEAFQQFGCDYTSDVPPGDQPLFRNQDIEVMSFLALEKAHKNATAPYEREHVTPYIWQNQKQDFFVGPIVAVPSTYHRRYRVVVDYPEDLALMEKIYERFYQPEAIIDVRDVFIFLDTHPEWMAVNSACKQKPIQDHSVDVV